MIFKLESRLPVSLFGKYPFTYCGLDFAILPIGMLSNTIKHGGKVLQRFHPLTVSIAAQDHNLIDQLSCLGLLYHDDEGNLALFLTHPCWFDRSAIEESLPFFLNSVEEFAGKSNVRCIRLEFHEKPALQILCPISLTDFTYDLSEAQIHDQDLDLLQEHGFRQERSLICYERNTLALEDGREADDCDSNYTIAEISQKEFEAIKKTNVFPARAYNLSSRDFTVSSRIYPSSLDEIIAVQKKSKWIQRGSCHGYAQWSPNLFEPSKTYGIPAPLLFRHALRDYRFKYGRILDWAFKDEDSDIFVFLISYVLRRMQKKGFEKCQTPYIDGKQEGVNAILEKHDFKRVQTTKVLAKNL